MTRGVKCCIESAAAGIITGGITFFAVSRLTNNHKVRRRTAAKAFKVLGNFMDAL